MDLRTTFVQITLKIVENINSKIVTNIVQRYFVDLKGSGTVRSQEHDLDIPITRRGVDASISKPSF